MAAYCKAQSQKELELCTNTKRSDRLKNVRPETIKLLEENIGKTLSDINYSKILYDPLPRIFKIKAKKNKWDLIKIKSFCTTKETISSVQFSSVAQSCPTLCDPMNRSTPGLPVHHHLPEFTQTHIHRVGDAIQPSHPLSSPFSSCLQTFPASGSFKMSQFFASGGQSI